MKKYADLPGVIGTGRRGVYFDIDDRQVFAGSTLGGPKCVCIVKSTGAVENIYSSDFGKTPIGTSARESRSRPCRDAFGFILRIKSTFTNYRMVLKFVKISSCREAAPAPRTWILLPFTLRSNFRTRPIPRSTSRPTSSLNSAVIWATTSSRHSTNAATPSLHGTNPIRRSPGSSRTRYP